MTKPTKVSRRAYIPNEISEHVDRTGRRHMMTEICGNCGHPYGYHKASASKAGPRDMCPPKKKSQDDYSWHQNWDESSGTLFFGTRLQMPKERYRAIIKFLVENGLDA